MPDVVSVPEAAGREALARLLAYGQPAVAPGPVALSAGGRVLFYVASGGAEDLPELLEWLDWGGVRLDLVARPEAEHTDPPVRWLHPATVPLQRLGGPEEENGGRAVGDSTEGADGAAASSGAASTVETRRADGTSRAGGQDSPRGASRRPSYPTPGLPEPPELIALLATIAAACHRLAVASAR
jgi:hypothetical protein